MNNRYFTVICGSLSVNLTAKDEDDAIRLFKLGLSQERRLQWKLDGWIINAYVSVDLSDIKAVEVLDRVRTVGCGRCGNVLVEADDKLYCQHCGAEPCGVEGCEGSHCRICGSHTYGDCYSCDGCDDYHRHLSNESEPSIEQIYAQEEFDVCIKAGLGTDHISAKYGLEEA